jgi:AcrR family transcriptional regulator
VDPSLIRYYFGDKNGLFTEVVQTILDEGRIVHQKILQSNLSPAEKIRARIEIYLETIFADPYQHQMIVELILYGRKPSAAVFRKKMVERAYAELKQLVQQSGATVEGAPADARFLHVAILGMCEYFITGQPLVRELFRSEPYSKALVNQYGRFIGNLVVRGLGLE